MNGPRTGSARDQSITGVPIAELRTRLRSALAIDAVDALDCRNQCLGPGINPLTMGDVLIGRALPVAITAVQVVPLTPYVGLLEALEAFGSGDVFVAATGSLEGVAIWGELITTACLQRGAVGSVCDGYARDSRILRAMDFPVFARGTVPYDSNGRSDVNAHGTTVQIDGVTVHHDDLIVADDDGIVVVPASVMQEAVSGALTTDSGESFFRSAVRDGMSATEAFRAHWVLWRVRLSSK